MPVKRLVRAQHTAQASTLRNRLAAEWRNPQSTATQPIIIEDRNGANQPLHLYVIWDDWGSLDMIERSEIIMDAYEDRYGAGSSVNVTVAMGLTSAEAQRLGISYQ